MHTDFRSPERANCRFAPAPRAAESLEIRVQLRVAMGQGEISQGEAAVEFVTINRSTHRFATLPPRSRPPSRPRPAVPTSVFLSRTPARPPRPSTAGSCSAPSSSLRTSRRRRRSSPSAATLAPSAVLRKVRTILHNHKNPVAGDIRCFEKWWWGGRPKPDGRWKELGHSRSPCASMGIPPGHRNNRNQVTVIITNRLQADRT